MACNNKSKYNYCILNLCSWNNGCCKTFSYSVVPQRDLKMFFSGASLLGLYFGLTFYSLYNLR